VENGYKTVHDWIARLVGQAVSSEPAVPTEARFVRDSPPHKRVKNEPSDPPLVMAVPPVLSPPAPPNPLAPAQPHLPFLPLFKQTASKRAVTVKFPTAFMGSQHSGHWTAKCIGKVCFGSHQWPVLTKKQVNDIEKGAGSGSSKQVAKEEAARQAYYAMGWAPN
jgi:hypothetical protein